MPLDLTEELMTQYGNPGDPAGYAMLDDDDNIVGYVVEGEDNDPSEGVTAITYSYYDDLGQFEYIEYEFVKDVGGVEVKYLNTYQFDEQENPIHIGEWKLTPGNLNGDSSAYTTVELAEWYTVPEITDHLPDVVWENVNDQGEGTVRYDITVANVSVLDFEATFGSPDSDPTELEIVSDLTTVSSNTKGILAWFNVDGTADPMATEGYYNLDIGGDTYLSSIPDADTLAGYILSGAVTDITTTWEDYNSGWQGGGIEGEMVIVDQLTDEQMSGAGDFSDVATFPDDNGDTIYSILGVVTEGSIDKSKTAYYDYTGKLFKVEVEYENSDGHLVSEIYDKDQSLIESATVNLGSLVDGVYDQVTVNFYVVSEDITLDAPPVLVEVIGSSLPGYYEGTQTFSGVTFDFGRPVFESATNVSEELAMYLQNGTLVAWSIEDSTGVEAYLNEAAGTSTDLKEIPVDPTDYRDISAEVAAWNAEQELTGGSTGSDDYDDGTGGSTGSDDYDDGTGGSTGSDGYDDQTNGDAKTEAELAAMESTGEGDKILYFESKTDSWNGGSETVTTYYGPAGLFVYEDVISVSNMGSSSYRSEVRRDDKGNELEYERVNTFGSEVSIEKKWAEEAENGEYTEYFERDDAYYYSLEAVTYSANPWANDGVEEINRYQISGDEYELYESGSRLIDNVYADVPSELNLNNADAAAGKEQFSRTIEGATIVDGEIVMGEGAVVTESWYERYLENGDFVGSVDSEDGIDTIQYPDPDNSNDRITVTRVSQDFLESLDDATAEGWVNPHEFYVGTGEPRAIFSEEEAQQINKVGHVVSEHTHDDDYGENFDPGQSPDGGMAGGDTQSTSLDSKTTYLDSTGKIFMIIEYSLNEGGGSTSEYMNVTRYDANGDVTSRIDGYSDSWQGSSNKSFQEYNGDYQFQGGEYTNGNTTEVFDENWNLIDSYVSVDTSGAEGLDSIDDAQAIALIETYYPETVSVVSDFEQYEDNWGGDSVTRTNSTGSVVLLDGNNDIVGQLSVWEQYVGEELESRSVELMDAGGQHIGNINVYGNSLDSNFIARFETAQTSSYTLDGVDTSFEYYEESTWENADISYDDDGNMVTTVIESSTYYFDNNWNLVYGEWNSGAVTTQYGEGWQIIGTSSNIADDAWTAVEGQEGVYQYVTERVEQHDDNYAMPGMAGGGSSTNTEVEILYSIKDGDDYVVTGRVEEYRWESEDGEYNISSNEYDADGNMVSSSWEDSFGNQGSYGSVVETRTIDGVDKEVTVESGSNGSRGWFYAYEYVYDEEWNFLEGYEINNGQKTSYGANWERLETTVAIDESQKDALDEVTQDMSVLESFADDAAFRGETNFYEDNFGDGSFSQVTYQYYNEDYELLYSEEFFTWEDESGYSSTSSNYQNAENEWIGSSHSDSNGNESSNISYTEVREIDGTDVSVRVESGSFTDGGGWSETYEYVYGENYNLIEGKLKQNGLVTVYGENWEVTSYGLDPNGDYVFTAMDDGSGKYEVTLGEFSDDGEGQVRVLVFDGDDVNASLVQSRETWRWSDPSGYWSENYSIYDANGNWVGSGSDDSNGFYYQSSETTQDLAAGDYTFLDSDYTDARVSANESGNSEQGWSESSVWYYAADWTFLGGTQTSDGMVVTYDSKWTIIDTAVDTSNVVLVEVLDDDGNLDGYYFEQSLGGNHGAMAAGGNQDATENQDTRTVYLDVDGETVTGSKETFYWDDGFGRTSISETYYDADGNWLSSSHESSDGYKSSYSQEVVEDGDGNVTGYVSSGTSVDPDGSSHSYEYTYNSNWSLVSGWEVRDDVRVEYGEGWVETARTVVESDDVVYTDVRDALGELTGYSTKKVVDESEGQDGISAKTTTIRFYDLEKEFTGYREKFVYSDETYRTASTTEYDADNNVIFEKYEDSEGFTFERSVENQYAEDGSLTGYIETGEELNPEGQDFEWSYTYDADGNFLGGTEIFDGATTRYGENWEVVSVQGDVRALDAVTDADGTVTGYYNESSNDISDQFGLFSMEETVRQEYSTTGQYLQEVVSYETTIDGETRTGMTVENSDEEIVFSQSENEAGDVFISGVYNDASEVEREYYLSVDDAGLSGSMGMTSSFFETDTPGVNDDGVIADASTSTVTLYSDGTEASSYKYTAEFFGDLLSLDGWTVNEDAFTANNQVELSDEMTALYADAKQLDGYAEGTSTKLILASLLKDYRYEEMLDNDLKSNGKPDEKEVSDVSQKGSAVAGTNSDGKAYIMFDSGSGHGMVLQGEFNKVDPDTEDDLSIKSQLASGNITSIKIYSAQNNGDIDQDADNIALEVSNIRVTLSSLYNNLDDLVPDAQDGTVLNAARYDIA